MNAQLDNLPIASYEQFLETKKIIPIVSGFDIDEKLLNTYLFDFQRVIVKWALKRGRAAIFADTGLGKTLMELSWSHEVYKNTGENILIAAPLCVAHQTVREGDKFGIEVNYCRSQDEVKQGINITNYEMLDNFDLSEFTGVVLDECFPPDTLIDCKAGRKHIKDIVKGDIIINASGLDVVDNIHRREVKYAVKIKYKEHWYIASPNHPIFTQRGWVGAQNLRAGDYSLETSAAMSMVRGDFYSEGIFKKHTQILRDILLSEMADEYTGVLAKSTQSGGLCETREVEVGMVQIGGSCCKKGDGENQKIESYIKQGGESQDFPDIESHEAQTFRAWGQWSWANGASGIYDGCTWKRLDSGICFVTGETSSGLSDSLQNGSSQFRNENMHRTGWELSSCEEGARYQERIEAGFVRVEGIEILEQGHPELEKYRDADGKLYFYDIGATQHPSFSVNGLLVHNSSILKNRDGKTRNSIIDRCKEVPYKLSCSATPSPNDYMELGNQVEFLGIMSMSEMLAMYFIHDGGETSKWILKGHGKRKFWEWMATWSVVIKSPSDLGFDGSKYILPGINYHAHVVESEAKNGLFADIASGLLERNRARKESVKDRVEKCAEIVNASSDQWVVWCHLNHESDLLAKHINDSVDIKGSDSIEKKERAINDFESGKIKVLISKPSITGFGLNWQHCFNTVFVGLSDSWESYYQAIRRFYRFGQTKEVNVHIIYAESEGAVVDNIKRKEQQNKIMGEEMVKHMADAMKKEVFGTSIQKTEYVRDVHKTSQFELHNADCIDLASEIDTESIDYTIFSPPFASLYTYSNSDRDMGNSKTHNEFFMHFKFLVDEMYRITRPGRLLSFHCMNLPTSKINHGYIGIQDFRGDLIRIFQNCGWIYHSEVVIWKDPVTAMQRTKALGLLHKQIKKDSAMSRQGIPDYLVTMRKPGINEKPISHTADEFPVDLWQRYASPVWMDINPSNTLQFRSAREEDDEKHICPLQLEVIERAMMLWTKKDDLVFSPFAGIGSEGYVALKIGRKFIGSELKPSYFKVAVNNLKEATKGNLSLFDGDEDVI